MRHRASQFLTPSPFEYARNRQQLMQKTKNHQQNKVVTIKLIRIQIEKSQKTLSNVRIITQCGDLILSLLTNDHSRTSAPVTNFLPPNNTNQMPCSKRFITTVQFLARNSVPQHIFFNSK